MFGLSLDPEGGHARTGSYVLGVPAVLVDENGVGIARPVSDGEILAHLDRHSAAVIEAVLQSAEYCSSCHKAAIPHELKRLQVAARDFTL